MTPTPEVLARVLKNLDDLEVPYALGGSMASSVWGKPRQTNDADIVVLIQEEKARALLNILQSEFTAAPSDPSEVLNSYEEFPSIQFIHIEETFRIDMFIAKPDEYAKESFARARLLPLTSDYAAKVAAPEDTVIAKLRWFVMGNRVSDRQWNDIIRVIEIQGTNFDFDYARKWSQYFGVLPELEQAASEAKPN